jgi:hypothetical protein
MSMQSLPLPSKGSWRTLSNTSMEMDEESLADVRRDNAIKTRCVRFGVDYIERRHGETSAEQQQRHNTLQKAIERERKRRARAQQSTEELRSTQDADTASRKRTRAQQSQEERDDGRRQDREARRRKRSVDDTRDSVFNDNCFHTLNPPDENFKKSLVMKAIKQAIRTKRPNGTHQATVCVVCDRVIIGEEKVCNISTERLEENRHRISVLRMKNSIANLCIPCWWSNIVEGLDRLLLSPRAYREGDNFECCQSCNSSMQASKAKKKGSKPPKYAIANGFAIGHFPSVIQIPGEAERRRIVPII